jgi:hypothetical protein
MKFSVDGSSFAFASNAEYTVSQNTVNASEIKGEAVSSVFTVRRPSVESVSITDGIANGEKVIAGSEEAVVNKYTFQVNNVRDVRLTDLTYTVNGNVYGGVSSLKLMVDGEVVSTENVNGANGATTADVTFNSLNVNVAKGGTKEVTVLATLSSSYSGSTLQVSLKSGSAEDSKGNNVTMPSTFTAGATFDVAQSAKIYVSTDSNAPVANIVAANPNTETEVARFKFKATDDDAQMQELTLVNVPTTLDVTTTTGAVDSTVAAYTGADAVVSTVYLYDTNGTKLATSVMTDGAAYFSFTSPVVFEEDVDKVLVVKVKTTAINTANNTNKTVRFAVLKAGETLAGTTKKTQIVSKANGQEVVVANQTYTNAVSNVQYFRKTIVSFANNAQTSTTLVAGSNDVYTFKATADEAGSAKVKEFTFDVTYNGASATTYEFYVNGNKEDDVTFTA